jgi:hypothetical protein
MRLAVQAGCYDAHDWLRRMFLKESLWSVVEEVTGRDARS